MQMNIAEAKAKLSELIAAAELGQEVVIARGGHPVVRLVPVQRSTVRIGIGDGLVARVPDFLEPMSEDEVAGSGNGERRLLDLGLDQLSEDELKDWE